MSVRRLHIFTMGCEHEPAAIDGEQALPDVQC